MPPRRRTGVVTKMKKVRAGIIGCGNIHSLHAYSVRALDHAELVAVCDERKERAEKTAEAFSCRAYTDWKEMVLAPDIDVIHICTPHYLHAPMAIFALENGKDVLTEKPMAIHIEDAEAMNEAARKSGRTLGVIFQNRWNPGSRLAKEIMVSGRLGKVKSARCNLYWNRPDSYYAADAWRGTWAEEGGGVIINQAIHTVDMLRWLLDSPIDYVETILENRQHPSIEVEDMAEGIVAYKNGVLTSFHLVNYYGCDENITVDILCENGKIHMEASKATVTFSDGEVLEADNDPNEKVPFAPEKNYWGIGHYKQIADFYDSLLKGEVPFVSGEEAIKTQALVSAMYASGKSKTRVYL